MRPTRPPRTSTSTAASRPVSAPRRSRAGSCSHQTSKAAPTRPPTASRWPTPRRSSPSRSASSRSSLDRRLRLNLTAYLFEVDGQQLTAVGGEFNIATLLNADKTEGHGFEADIEWTPDGNWLMTFGASWNPTKIKDKNLTVSPCGGGCTITRPDDPDGLVLIDGNPLPHAPKTDLQRHRQLPLGPGHQGLLRHPRLGLLQRQELLPLRVEGVPRLRASRSACGPATPGTRPATRSRSSCATSSTPRSSAAASISTT